MSWTCVTEPCRAVIKHERCLSWALEADVQSGRTGRPWASTQRFRPAFNDGLPRCPTESPQCFLVIQPAPSWACDSHAQRCARSNAHGNQKPAPAPSGSQAMAWHGMALQSMAVPTQACTNPQSPSQTCPHPHKPAPLLVKQEPLLVPGDEGEELCSNRTQKSTSTSEVAELFRLFTTAREEQDSNDLN